MLDAVRPAVPVEKLATCCERGIYESVDDVLTCRADLNLTPAEVRLLTARTEWIWVPE